jgi:DNA-binding HxlR family transcriptional regulator
MMGHHAMRLRHCSAWCNTQAVEQRSSELRRDFTSTADMLAADLSRLAKDGASLRGDVCSIAGERCLTQALHE